MLDQVTLSNPLAAYNRQKRLHRRQLMVSGEYLCALDLFRLFIPLFNDLSEVLDDVGELWFGKDLFPKIIGLDARRIGGIPRTAFMPLVERQEP